MELQKIPGISEETIKKMKEIGYDTIESVAVETALHLSSMLEVQERVAAKYITAAKSGYRSELTTAEKKKIMMEKIGRISTGSSALDKILKGTMNIKQSGIMLQALTEMAGAFGTGKTQACFTMSVTAQLPLEDGGQNGSVFYIDTEATFRPNRIEEIAKARKLNPEEILKNIYLIDAPVSSKLIMDINSLGYTIKDFNIKNPKKKVKMVIVDSLIAPFRADYLGRGELAPRQQALGHCLQVLQRLAKENDLAVVFTNQVLARPDAMYGDPTIPAGGHVVAHKAQYRLFLRKGQQNKRVVKIIDAPDLEEAEELITITEKGIE